MPQGGSGLIRLDQYTEPVLLGVVGLGVCRASVPWLTFHQVAAERASVVLHFPAWL